MGLTLRPGQTEVSGAFRDGFVRDSLTPAVCSRSSGFFIGVFWSFFFFLFLVIFA